MRIHPNLACATLVAAALAVGFAERSPAQTPTIAFDKPMPAGARVFLAPAEVGFDIYLAAAIQQKKVPLVIVSTRDKADFEISSLTETEKAGWARMLVSGSSASTDQAGIKVTNIRTGEVVFAYAVTKLYSARGKQSVAEACAKHLKKKVGK